MNQALLGKLKRLLFIALIILVSYDSKSQTSNVLPFQFDQLSNSFEMVNASSIDTSRLKLKIGNNIYSPDLRAFRTHYFVSRIRLTSWEESRSKAQQYFGANMYLDRVSRFIHNNRFLISYAWRKQLFRSTTLTAATNSGVLNRTLKTNTVSTSDFAPSLNFGISIKHKKIKVGIATNQLSNSSLSPLFETSRFVRHYVYNFGSEFDINERVKIRSSIYYLQVSKLKDQLDIVLNFQVNRVITFGFDYRHQRSLVFLAGLEDFTLRRNQGKYDLMMSYNMGTSRYRGGAIELTMAYQL